jgi:hypothetical protein
MKGLAQGCILPLCVEHKFYIIWAEGVPTMLWRHGDVLIATTESLPADARPRRGQVLVRGEATGHSHRIAEPAAAQLWESGTSLFLRVVAGRATVVHEEHRPIVLPRGMYRVWTQREYSPREIRQVLD